MKVMIINVLVLFCPIKYSRQYRLHFSENGDDRKVFRGYPYSLRKTWSCPFRITVRS